MIYDSKRVLNFDIQPRRVLMRQLSGRERWKGGRRRNPPLPPADLRSLARGVGEKRREEETAHQEKTSSYPGHLWTWEVTDSWAWKKSRSLPCQTTLIKVTNVFRTQTRRIV